MQQDLKYTGRIRVGAGLLAGFFLTTVTSAFCGSSDIPTETWAVESVQKSMEKMRESKNYQDAQVLALKAKKQIDQQQEELNAFMHQEYPPNQDPTGNKDLPPVGSEYDLIISESVPLETLRTYAQTIDTLRHEKGIAVRMVMRGFVDGMQKIRPTIDFINSVISMDPHSKVTDGAKQYAVKVDIDPERSMEVNQVPALAKKEGDCFVYGDSSLEDLISRLEGGKCNEVAGKTEAIQEKNAIEEIKEAAGRVDTDKLQQQMREGVKASLHQLPGQGMLPASRQDETRKIYPEAVLDFDVPDPDYPEEILYPKGFRFNPLDFSHAQFKVMMFAGDRPEEVQFVNKWVEASGQLPAGFTLLALGGDYDQLVNDMGRAVFSGIRFADQGWCHATPCLMSVTQGNNWVDVREFVVPGR